jgi:hypothetical protein
MNIYCLSVFHLLAAVVRSGEVAAACVPCSPSSVSREVESGKVAAACVPCSQ